MNKTKWLLLAFVGSITLGYSSAAINVSSCDDLANVNNDLTTGYTLTQDLDCSGSGNSIMIGSDSSPFIGSLDGNGYTITIDINDAGSNYIGLFRRTNNATISDFGVSGTVHGDTYVGGLIGYGENTDIYRSYFKGSIQGDVQVGGLIGFDSASTIYDSYSSSSVQGNIQVGGLVGFANITTIHRSYSSSSVQGSIQVGGLVGFAANNAISSGSFWDTDIAGGASPLGSGLTTTQMYNAQIYLDTGWDFTGTWDINSAWNSNYPFLQWQTFDTMAGSEVMVYMNNNGPAGATSQSISIEYTNSYDADLTGVVLTLYGDIYATGYQEASGGNNPTFNGMVDGSYIQWIIPSFPENASGVLDLIITQPTDGAYVYTATIAAPYNTEYYPGNNNFHITSTVDTLTQAPTLLAPTNGSTHIRTAQMDISFSIPEAASTNSIQLHFIPQDLSGGTVSLTLADVTPNIQQDVSLSPEDILTLPWVASTNASDIPNGNYTVVLSYQDIFGNPAASDIVNNVTIIDNPGPYVLTEVTPIPSSVTSLSVLYSYSSIGTGEAELIVSDCGWESLVTAEAIQGNGSTRHIQISNLQVGRTYECTITINAIGGVSNTLTMGPFTVAAASSGGSISIDYCPYGDTSGSYYDGNCGPEKSLVEKIVAKLTNDWKDRSNEKIQGMLATLTLLNNKIQALDSVSMSMKELFKNIVGALVEHYTN